MLCGLLLVGMMLAAAQCWAAVLPTVVRGSRGILLLPEQGPLTIKVTKRDLNIYEGADEMIAQLFSPQRQLLATMSIPDDGNAAKGGYSSDLQSAEATVTCETPGVYRLLVSGTSSDFVFGMEASCDRYVVEGDIMLNNGGVGGRIFFQPPAGEFTITAQALHSPGRQEMPLLDAEGTLLHTFSLTKAGDDQVLDVGASLGARDRVWYFDIGKMDVKIVIPGVEFWSVEQGAYFAAKKSRWMLMPWKTVRYLQPAERAEIEFKLHNGCGKDAAFNLQVVAGPGLEAVLVEPAVPVNLSPSGAVQVRVMVKAAAGAKAGDTLIGHIVATAQDDPAIVQSAGIEVRVGESPVSQPLTMPIVLERYQHENYQFGYAPDYVENEVYFDPANRPFIRDRTSHKYFTSALTLLEDGGWVKRPFVPMLKEIYTDFRGIHFGSGSKGAKVAFDGDGGAYTIVRVMRTDNPSVVVLLYSPDDGQTYTVHELQGSTFDIEQFTGHNALQMPPPVLDYVWIKTHEARFCSYHTLQLLLPKKEGDKLVLGEPVVVSDKCLGSCQHSGGPASTATRDGKTHIVWGEVTDPDDPGVPTYIATYDHATGKLGETVFMEYAPPVNDVHNVPAVCLDSEGYIHVLTGAHGLPFRYLRSLKPNDAYSGFTEPVDVLDAGYVDENTDEDGSGRQTYISLLCDPQDTLHIAYRQWRRNADEHHPGRIYAALSVQSKRKGEAWGPARPLVIPPVPGYSIYYHKLTIDRRGWLYLSYNHWTSDTSYQKDYPERYHNRAVLVSQDYGATWKLAETGDFIAGLL